MVRKLTVTEGLIMTQNRYINRNSFPIFVPDQRGGQVMVKPGEFTTNEWFSRFVGKGRLSKEEVVVTTPTAQPKITTLPYLQKKGPQPKVPVVSQAETPAPAAVPRASFKNEETDTYKLVNGIYSCKLCGLFHTGSSSSMNEHISSYHGQQEETAPQPTPALLQEETVVRTTKAAQGTPAVQTIRRTAPIKPATEPSVQPDNASEGAQAAGAAPATSEAAEAHACEHPGCGKVFASADGLRRHAKNIHGTKKGKG